MDQGYGMEGYGSYISLENLRDVWIMAMDRGLLFDSGIATSTTAERLSMVWDLAGHVSKGLKPWLTGFPTWSNIDTVRP